LEPPIAEGPADPWFRPVWEDGDDDDPLPCPAVGRRLPARLRREAFHTRHALRGKKGVFCSLKAQ
jgi:hypothetical protein